ncbi:hypothetical protein SprV_0100335100 [Sparganum proliferum]
MARQLHDGMMARATDNGAVSTAFAVTNGVTQGCVLAPTLFSLMFSAMLMDAYSDERPGIHTPYRTDDHLLNQRRMHFQSRVSTTIVHDLLFADDCALNTTSGGDIQRRMDLFATACENFGLVIDTEKTVGMHQSPPPVASQITVNGTQLQVVDNFTYLGSTLSCSTKIDDEVARRISKASQFFGRLQNTSDTEAKVVGPDPRHGRTGVNGNPQHLRYTETTTTTLERPPFTDGRRAATQTTLLWRCRHGFTLTRSSSPALQGYSEYLPEAPADQPGKLGRPRPGPTYVEEDSEDRRSNLRSPTYIPTAAPPHDANAQPPPMCPRCQRTFQTLSKLIGHLRTNCSTRTAPTVVSPPTSPSPSTNVDRPSQPPLPPPSSSTTTASTSDDVTSVMPITTTHNPDTPTPPPSTPVTRAGCIPVLIAIALSPHVSA